MDPRASASLRRAVPSDLDEIYLMGFDAWADGSPESDYLEACRNSSKYKKGTWYVLEEGSSLLSSLIVYPQAPNQFGIGSIATPKPLRNRGYASSLISKVIEEIERGHPSAVIFLYSDISPEFYEKFGFRRLPAELQRYNTTTCMLRGNPKPLQDKSDTPEYF